MILVSVNGALATDLPCKDWWIFFLPVLCLTRPILNGEMDVQICLNKILFKALHVLMEPGKRN